MQYLLAVDLETTGLDPDWHEITQIGVIMLDKGLNHIDHFKSLVKVDHPERGIREGFNVYEYTGITPESLETAPSLEKVIEKLLRFVRQKTCLLNGDRQEITIFGQNPGFDKAFLEAAFRQVGKRWPFDYHVIDLASIYVAYHLLKFGEIPDHRPGLKQICEHFETPQLEAHDAMNDISQTIGMLKHTLKEMRATIPQKGCMDPSCIVCEEPQ